MTAVGGGGNYISDGQIMAWLAQQQDRIYDDLRESMDLSQARANFTDELNTIKANLQEANETKDFSKVNGELQAFVERYGEDPQFAAICRDLGDMASTIAGGRQAHTDYQEALIKHRDACFVHDALERAYMEGRSPNPAGPRPTPPREPAPQSYSDENIKSWIDLIGGKVDSLAKNDQLTMIHIQELKATLDQGAQLGSTFISSGDKTSSAIINNIA